MHDVIATMPIFHFSLRRSRRYFKYRLVATAASAGIINVPYVSALIQCLIANVKIGIWLAFAHNNQ